MASEKGMQSTPRGTIIDMKTGEPVKKADIPIICERIRYYRKRMKLEQKEFAEKIGVSGNSVNNWERGRARPDVGLLPAICDVLNISFSQLYGMDAPNLEMTQREKKLVKVYHRLNNGHKYAVDSLAAALMEVQTLQEKQKVRQKVFSLPLYSKPLAAGVGDPSEFENDFEPFYLYDLPENRRADCVFKVNGDSMEPAFPDGSFVLVQRVTSAGSLKTGEIGAFIVGNELYIKEYEKDGLHSLNPAYGVLQFESEENVYLIGRVLKAVADEDMAEPEDIRLYQTVEDAGM